MEMALDEFGLIAELFAPLAKDFPGAFNLLDDVAVLAEHPGQETVITVDAMVAGVHFFPDDPPGLIAQKLVRVNLSDLAAKGAFPFAVLLSAAFPAGTDMAWLQGFASGLGEDLSNYGISLIGGDTVSTPGPLTLSLTALGRVATGRAILRSTAAAGDLVWVSGCIGDAALGLMAVRKELKGLPKMATEYLADRFRLPQPRVKLGKSLVGIATAGMDVSDGLVQDLGHLCRASGVGAVVSASAIPLSAAGSVAVGCDHSLLAAILTGGDDYELLFTAPLFFGDELDRLAIATGVPLTKIGRVIKGSGVRVEDSAGKPLVLEREGWRHFNGAGGA